MAAEPNGDNGGGLFSAVIIVPSSRCWERRTKLASEARSCLSLPHFLWGGWLAEGQSGGVVGLQAEAPPARHIVSLRSRCALPRASFARLDPTKGGGIRKNERAEAPDEHRSSRPQKREG